MNIKSLLLGSAAAMVAVSGARAADAVVIAEPEPVEYVRVCDAYGAGFFYIPGTETCLQISGYVWYQIGASSYDPGDTPAVATNVGGDGWLKSTRARFNVDARSETEWGTLRSYIRFQADWGTQNDGPVATDQAFIQLGGLMMGYSESFWVDSKNGGASNYGSHSWTGMHYGYQQRHLIGYRWQGGNGLFAAASLEDDTLAGDGYMPDIVGKLGISQGWGTLWGTVGYDESRNAAGDAGFGVAVGLVVNVPNAPGSSLRVIGYYNDSDNAYGPIGSFYRNTIGVEQPEFSILASYQHRFSPTLAASVALQYFSDFYLPGSDVSTNNDGWGAEFQIVWTPVTNFEVRTELHYDDYDGYLGETVSGYLRFTRYF